MLRLLVIALLFGHGVLAARMPWSSQEPCSGNLQKGAVLGSVLSAEGGFRFAPGVHEDAVAQGVYVDSAYTASNFGKLRIVTNGNFTDLQQMQAAGWIEGYLTAARVYDHHYNLKHYFKQQLNASLERPMAWLHQQEAWINAEVSKHPRDPYWQAIGLLLAQNEGLAQGYKARAAEEPEGSDVVGHLSEDDLLFLSSNGDLYDIMDMYEAQDAEVTGVDKYSKMSPAELYQELGLQGKCSALIKVTADLSDLLFGHSTFDSFTAMTRIFKHYQFSLKHPGVKAQALSFSSYPGELFSDDDLYMTSAKLVVLETTNHIYNPKLFKALTPQSVLSWQRVRLANLLADSGEGWVQLFKIHNSGTYNNQYMITDLKKFKPRVALEPGLLWVVEQIPGKVVAADMTSVLVSGYWPSYNVAFFPEIYEACGYPNFIDKQQKRGDGYDVPTKWLMYQVSPRANIFRRSQSNVTSVAGMRHMMRYNDYKHDPLSHHHPTAAVCARGDLAKEGAIPKGCYDTKVTSYSMAWDLEAEVVGGPTAQEQPAFQWEPTFGEFAHRGMPNRFDFTFERMSAAELPLQQGCSTY